MLAVAQEHLELHSTFVAVCWTAMHSAVVKDRDVLLNNKFSDDHVIEKRFKNIRLLMEFCRYHHLHSMQCSVQNVYAAKLLRIY